MEEVFKKWDLLKKQYPMFIHTHHVADIFDYMISEYYKQGKEVEDGITKLNCFELFKFLGLSDRDVYDGSYHYGEDHFDYIVLNTLEFLDRNEIIFYLLEPSVSRPFYSISLSPVINGLIDFEYNVIKEKHEKRYK